jgi:integrase
VCRTSTGADVSRIEPRNLVRSFARIRDSHRIRKIRVHTIRHTTASLLKDLSVPARDTQIILEHGHIPTTQQVYVHVDEAARREPQQAPRGRGMGRNGDQPWWSTATFTIRPGSFRRWS